VRITDHKSLIMQYPPVPCYLTPLVSQYLPQALFILRSSLNEWDEAWQWRKPNWQNCSPVC